MRLYLVLSLAILLMAAALQAQSKGQIKDLGIKSTTVWEYDYSSGKENKKLESVEKYNSKGYITESTNYDKSGKLKERINYKYNENNDVIEEIYFDSSNKLKKLYKYTYQGKLRKTKEKYDSSNKLVWRKVFVYEM